MKLSKFLWDKKITILLLISAMVTIEIFLLIYNFQTFIKIYIPISIFTMYGIGIGIEYIRKKKFYHMLFFNLEELDQKYLIREVIQEPGFEEGKLLISILEQTDKSMVENVKTYQIAQEEYKEYIELWIHEIKLPIAAGKLVVENNKNETTKSINEELDKIEDYIDQALFYARSNTVEKDYILRKTNLKDIVTESLKKNKTQFIINNVTVELKDLEKDIYTDSKWINFILNQILVNSIKYSKQEQKKIILSAEEEKERVILQITDNGIGIKENEVKRVFEKGFTGSNGRLEGKKSTGIGLYLSKKLCDKLGLGITLESKEGKGTCVTLIFPKNSFMRIEK